MNPAADMNLTLEDIALLNVVALFYNDPEVRQQALNLEDFNKEWKKIISNKVSKLTIPFVFQKRITRIVRRVGLKVKTRLLRFDLIHSRLSTILLCERECYKLILPLSPQLESDELFAEGKIIEILVRDQQIYMAFRFTLACEFNLKNHIFSIWRQMSQTMKGTFHQDNLSLAVDYWAKALFLTENIMLKIGSVNLEETFLKVMQRIEKSPSLKFDFERISPTDIKWPKHGVLETRQMQELHGTLLEEPDKVLEHSSEIKKHKDSLTSGHEGSMPSTSPKVRKFFCQNFMKHGQQAWSSFYRSGFAFAFFVTALRFLNNCLDYDFIGI